MQESKRDIIVHPRFLHTVVTLPVSQAPRPPTRWEELPLAALHVIAGHCQSAQELCNFTRICKASRCVLIPGPALAESKMSGASLTMVLAFPCRTASDDDQLWCRLCCTKFNSSPSQKNDTTSWKALYRQVTGASYVRDAHCHCALAENLLGHPTLGKCDGRHRESMSLGQT